MITREDFLAIALHKMLTPYLYGAKGDIMVVDNQWVPVPRNPLNGAALAYDCSGLPMSILHDVGGPDLRRSHYTDVLWADARTRGRRDLETVPNPDFPPTEEPEPGDLALYGGQGGDVSHVMIVLNKVGKLYMVFGASGGTSSTLTYQIASARRACVKVKETHLYRPDFRGFRSMSKFLG